MLGRKSGGVKLYIIARRSGSRIMLIDQAYRVTDKKKGTDVYKLKKMKETIRPIEYENIVQNMEGNFAPCFSPSKGEFFPMYLDETYTAYANVPIPIIENGVSKKDENGNPMYETEEIEGENGQKQTILKLKRVEVRGHLETVNEDQKSFFYNENIKAFSRFKRSDFWEKYGGLISLLITGIALGLVFLFWSQAASTMSANNLASAQVLKQITDVLQGVQSLHPAI